VSIKAIIASSAPEQQEIHAVALTDTLVARTGKTHVGLVRHKLHERKAPIYHLYTAVDRGVVYYDRLKVETRDSTKRLQASSKHLASIPVDNDDRKVH
jgi:hypothetical protein